MKTLMNLEKNMKKFKICSVFILLILIFNIVLNTEFLIAKNVDLCENQKKIETLKNQNDLLYEMVETLEETLENERKTFEEYKKNNNVFIELLNQQILDYEKKLFNIDDGYHQLEKENEILKKYVAELNDIIKNERKLYEEYREKNEELIESYEREIKYYEELEQMTNEIIYNLEETIISVETKFNEYVETTEEQNMFMNDQIENHKMLKEKELEKMKTNNLRRNFLFFTSGVVVGGLTILLIN